MERKAVSGSPEEAVRGYCVWLTGLPCSGKTTLAGMLLAHFIRKGNEDVELLDGDEVRKWLSPDLGFSKDSRVAHVHRVTMLAKSMMRMGKLVIVSLVSPYEDLRNDAIKALDCRVFLVHVSAPLAVCKSRDVKGMYARAEKGQIRHFTGVSDPYERPNNPDLTVYTAGETAAESFRKILERLREPRKVR